MTEQVMRELLEEEGVSEEIARARRRQRQEGGVMAASETKRHELERARRGEFDDFPEAFDYCREVDRPVVVTVLGERWKLFPSGAGRKEA